MEKLSLVLEQIAFLIVVAVMIERALTFLFDARPIRDLVTGKGRLRAIKPWVALLTSVAIVFHYEVDLLRSMFEKPGSDATLAGLALTSLMLAGASAGMITLFHDVLGWSKESRDAARKRREAGSGKSPPPGPAIRHSGSAGQFGL